MPRIIAALLFLLVINLNTFAKDFQLISPYIEQDEYKVYYLGCQSDKNEAQNILELLHKTETAWNKHDINALLDIYDKNFHTRDNLTLDDVQDNLGQFWFHYADSKVSSIPTSIYVCGNYATVNMLEETDASRAFDNTKAKHHFKSWVRGITSLKKFGDTWRITKEDVITETVWKYFGPIAGEVLNRGYIKLIVPDNVISGENYIARLEHDLPPEIRALAFIDHELLASFEGDSLEELKKDEKDLIAQEQKHFQEISRALQSKDELGLRRLFTANTVGQSELVTAHIEFLVFPNKENPKQFKSGGMITISQRVQPEPAAVKEEKIEEVTKSLRNEIISK